jgi:hypothetical protein
MRKGTITAEPAGDDRELTVVLSLLGTALYLPQCQYIKQLTIHCNCTRDDLWTSSMLLQDYLYNTCVCGACVFGRYVKVPKFF